MEPTWQARCTSKLESLWSGRPRGPEAANMSLYVIADIHAANSIAQLWTDHVKLPFQTG